MARHKEFEREEVLDKAMDLFWRQGYEATSIQDLVNCMGINRGSLYDTFGGKHKLFLAALERYLSKFSQRLQRLENSPAGIAAIRQFFLELLESRVGEKGCQGCMVTNSTIELILDDPDTANRIQSQLTRMETAFYKALVRAKAQEEISPNHNLRALARFLVSSAHGSAVIAKTSPDSEVLEDIVNVTLSVLN